MNKGVVMKKVLCFAVIFLFVGAGTAIGEFTDLGFVYTVDDPAGSSKPLDTCDDAYRLVTDNDGGSDYYVDFSDETCAAPAFEDLTGLYLSAVEGPTLEDLALYYEDRGTPDPWLSYLLDALKIGEEEQTPFAYILQQEDDDGCGLMLLDAAMFEFGDDGESSVEVPMRIPGDYPCGKYTVETIDGDVSLTLAIVNEDCDTDLDCILDEADDCPDSALDPVVVVDGCDTGVNNLFFENGCTITDLIIECAADTANHGLFVSCVADLTNALRNEGFISGAEKGAIQSCAAEADIGFEDGEGDGFEDGETKRARYMVSIQTISIPCLVIGEAAFSLDLKILRIKKNNIHFRLKKAMVLDPLDPSEADALDECATYDMETGVLELPALEIGGSMFRVDFKLINASANNLLFRIIGLADAADT